VIETPIFPTAGINANGLTVETAQFFGKQFRRVAMRAGKVDMAEIPKIKSTYF